MPTKNIATQKENLDLTKAGRYIYGLGRRKTAIATVRLYFDCPKEMKGAVIVNKKEAEEYFPSAECKENIFKGLIATGMGKKDVLISAQ